MNIQNQEKLKERFNARRSNLEVFKTYYDFGKDESELVEIHDIRKPTDEEIKDWTVVGLSANEYIIIIRKYGYEWYECIELLRDKPESEILIDQVSQTTFADILNQIP